MYTYLCQFDLRNSYLVVRFIRYVCMMLARFKGHSLPSPANWYIHILVTIIHAKQLDARIDITDGRTRLRFFILHMVSNNVFHCIQNVYWFAYHLNLKITSYIASWWYNIFEELG